MRLEFDSLDELKTFWAQTFGKTLSSSSSAQVVDKQVSSTAASTAAPTQQPVQKSTSTVTPVATKEEEEDDLLGEEEEPITKDAIRALAAEKAKSGHRDAIKAKLAELKAASVSAIAEKDFGTFYKFLNGLKDE